jgi:hypothetical protein
MVCTGNRVAAQNTTVGQTATPAASPAAKPAPELNVPPDFPQGQWLLSFENDWFYGTDRDLTNDLALYYITPNYTKWEQVPGIPNFLGHFVDWASMIHDPMATVSGAFYAQQNIYTPSNISLAPPNPYDHPYAGWVAMGIDAVRQTGYRRTVFEITPGWVGPESGAQQLQTSWHNTIGVTSPKGWYYQIKNEPILQLTYRQDWRPAALTNLNEKGSELLGYDVIGHGTITVGNGWDYIAAGVMGRVGYHLPLDYGPARPRLGEIATMPYQPGGTTPTKAGWGWDGLTVYACLGFEGRAIAHDITLDGNTFANSASVVNEPLVWEAYGGPVVQYGNLYAAFLTVFETETFRSQPGGPQWRGIATLGCRF